MKKTYEINYQTEWRHHYLKPEHYLYFEANTPIEEILPQLETRLNQLYMDIRVNYKTKSRRLSFNRLYRNVIAHFNGWQVFYRKPGSKGDYHSISEKIGFKSRASNRIFKQKVLTKPMCWTHEFYPLIDPVEIKGATSCESIAQRLNASMSKPNYKAFFSHFQPYHDRVLKIYKELKKRSVNLNFKDHDISQTFCEDLKTMYHCSQQFHFLLAKDYRVYLHNVHDVLVQDNNTISTKGWHVKFIN